MLALPLVQKWAPKIASTLGEWAPKAKVAWKRMSNLAGNWALNWAPILAPKWDQKNHTQSQISPDIDAKVDSEGSLKVGSKVGGEVGLSVVVKSGSEGRWRESAWAPIWVAIIVGSNMRFERWLGWP